MKIELTLLALIVSNLAVHGSASTAGNPFGL